MRRLSTSEIVEQLPHTLQLRFNNLSGYVDGVITEIEDQLGHPVSMEQDDRQFIQLVCLLYLLGDFFRSGTRAARSSVALFKDLGCGEFSVGSTKFSHENDNVRRGELLADNLLKAIAGTRLEVEIRRARGLRELISNLVRQVSKP